MGLARSAAALGATGVVAAAWAMGCATANRADERTASTSAPILSYPSTEGRVDYSGNPTGANLLAPGHGMIGPITVYLVFYGADWAAGDMQLARDFIDGLSGSPTASVLASYDNGEGTPLPSVFTRSTKEYWDTGYSYGTDLTQTQIGQVVQKGVTTAAFPSDRNALYVVMPDDTVNAVSPFSSGPFCGNPGVCGYHPVTSTGLHATFAINPGFCASPGQLGSCQSRFLPAPNGANGTMDAMLDVVWHEIAEQITDPGEGWFVDAFTDAGVDIATEIADQCESFTYDSVNVPMVGMVQYDFLYTTASGALANTHLGSGSAAHDYTLQPLWQNVDRGGCVRRLMLNRPAAVPTRNLGLGFATGDLDKNGIGDLLWRDTRTGAFTAVLISPSDTVLSTQSIPSLTASLNDQIYGFGDFNGDGEPDLLWHQGYSQTLYVTDFKATTPLSTSYGFGIATGVTPKELLKAIGDFDGNGQDDILFQSVADNSTRIAFNPVVNPVTVSSSGELSNLPVTSPAASPTDDSETLGTGDFDGDGTSELLWHDLAHGTYRTWKFTDPNHTGKPTHVTSTPIAITAPTFVVGIVDVDRDGTADLLGADYSSTGELVWVRMLDGVPAGPQQSIHAYPDKEWRFSGGSRFGGGRTGLLWYNRETGSVARWAIDSTGTFLGSVHLVASEPMTMQLISN